MKDVKEGGGLSKDAARSTESLQELVTLGEDRQGGNSKGQRTKVG